MPAAKIKPSARKDGDACDLKKQLLREKARMRMAQYRLQLKSASPEAQHKAQERARAANAKYRENNRIKLKAEAVARRISAFTAKHGPTAHADKLQQREAKQKELADKQRRKSRAKRLRRKQDMLGMPIRARKKMTTGEWLALRRAKEEKKNNTQTPVVKKFPDSYSTTPTA